MRILLTGAKGQLGRAIKERLPENWELIATDSKSLDITDRQAVMNMAQNFQPDVIINTAAYTDLNNAEHNREKAFALNAEGPCNLAQAALEVGAKLVHISADYVFNSKLSTKFKETDAPFPEMVCGHSKLAGEVLVLSSGADALVIRTSILFSETGGRVVPALLQQARAGETILLADDQTVRPTYAGDLAQAIIELLQKTVFPFGIIHYSGNNEVSSYRFGLAVLEAEAARNPDFKMPEVRAVKQSELGRAAHPVLDCSKAKSMGLQLSEWQNALPQVLAALAR